MAFKSPISLLIGALIVGIVIYSPLIINYDLMDRMRTNPFNFFINLGIYTSVYIGTLLVIWIIFRIRNA